MQVFAIKDITYTDNYIPVLLINFEHFPGSFCCRETEQRDLKRNFIDIIEMLFDALYSLRQYLVSIHVNHVFFTLMHFS